MNRIDQRFKILKKLKQKAVVIFVTAGDPSLEVTRQVLRFADKIGVDCVELGVPFSDPLADGPVIQASSFRALQKNVNLQQIMDLVRRERKAGIRVPIALMSSINPVFHYGMAKAAAAARRSGVDAWILPDLPVHEAAGLLNGKAADSHNILMVTPTTEPARRKSILQKAKGFIYYVSLTGVTGLRKRANYPFKPDVQRLRRGTHAPVCVGFGVSTPQQARDISKFADGVIVGSAIVRHLSANSRKGLSESSKRFIRSFVSAVKGGQ